MLYEVITVTLLGQPDTLKAKAAELGVSLDGVTLLDPKNAPQLDAYVAELVKLREKKGLTADEARKLLTGDDNLYFGSMMVHKGRITSYNVCYTKLLRRSRPARTRPGWRARGAPRRRRCRARSSSTR